MRHGNVCFFLRLRCEISQVYEVYFCLSRLCFAPINCTNSRHGTFYFESYFISSSNDLKNLYIFLGKGGFGNTKFIAFEKLAWHYECFICGLCNESMVGKGFIQEEGSIICPECARKKMLEEMEAENQE